MCRFFSCVSDGHGRVMYFDFGLRKKYLSKELDYYPDSHTSIADYFGYTGSKEDALNKYEYNPLTKEFTVDQINTVDDSKSVRRFCEELDFRTIVPELILKPVIHPLRDVSGFADSEALRLLKEWAIFWDSLGDNARSIIKGYVRGSIWDRVSLDSWNNISLIVYIRVGNDTKRSIVRSVSRSYSSMRYDGTLDAIHDSVKTSIDAYAGSFFDIWGDEYKYQSAVDLWERGLVPSFNGKTWRLHSKKGIAWEGTMEHLERIG